MQWKTPAGCVADGGSYVRLSRLKGRGREGRGAGRFEARVSGTYSAENGSELW